MVEHCRKANAGLWYESYEEFKEAMNYLISNAEVASKMGKNGKKYVIENYSWDKIEKKYLEFVK
jgi:glycosyltransferase involved in cell wall biosynthesis